MDMCDVAIVGCADYEATHIREALIEAFAPFGGFDFVKAGMKIAIKANLVHASKPEKAAVAHPALLAELTKLLVERGAEVVVGDSPGGLYNSAILGNVYRACGMSAVKDAGGSLNHDFSQETVDFPQGQVAKQFPFTSWLHKADLIINVCKLKTHGMMGMSCAAKNMFGVVPGTAKLEFHYLYPNHADFARMICDLEEYTAPAFSVCDGVWGMEGNGPTGGTPRHLGCILVSPSPHKLDMVAATVIGLTPEQVPTLEAAIERGLTPKHLDEIAIMGDISQFSVTDFKNVAASHAHLFSAKDHKGIKRVLWTVVEKLIASRPDVHTKDCIGCGKCKELCPAKAIEIVDKKAKISRKTCIKCFCCQEFCPVSAIKVKRTFLAKRLNRR